MTKKQGQTESDDDSFSSFNSRLGKMSLDGGAHVLCSLKIIGKT